VARDFIYREWTRKNANGGKAEEINLELRKAGIGRGRTRDEKDPGNENDGGMKSGIAEGAGGTYGRAFHS
jgi:hypothetical protein